MSVYTLYNLSEALGVSCDYIVRGSEETDVRSFIDALASSLSSEDMRHMEQILKHIVAIKNNKKNTEA